MEYNIPLEEQETTINMYPRQIQTTAEIYSSDTKMIDKLKKLAEKHPEIKINPGDGYGVFFSVPKDWVSIKPKRKMSEEQKKAATERLQKMRENQFLAEKTSRNLGETGSLK